MERVIITVQRSNEDQILDIEAPADMSIQQLVSNLTRGFGWDLDAYGRPVKYVVKVKNPIYDEERRERVLSDHETLTQAQVWDGAWLFLFLQEKGHPLPEKTVETPLSGLVNQWQAVRVPISQPVSQVDPHFGQAKKVPTTDVRWKQIDE